MRLAHPMGMHEVGPMMFGYACFVNNETHVEWLSLLSLLGLIKSRAFRGLKVRVSQWLLSKKPSADPALSLLVVS